MAQAKEKGAVSLAAPFSVGFGFRPEIEGLRALAILPVLAYHANANWLPGGFLGVDIFFVISGALITRLLLADVRAGTFSFGHFYARRAARLLPALLIVLLACAVAINLIMLPREAREAGRSIIAASLFVSNFHFWRDTGYFALDGHFKPLLHSWSLSVEEQFYLLYPLLLLALLRFAGQRLPYVLMLAALASLGLAWWGTQAMPAATFYLLPFRAWELLAGALLVVSGARLQRSIAWANIIALAGLALVIAALLLAKPESGIAMFLPLLAVVTGAAMLFHWGSAPAIRPLLDNQLVRYVGRISYALYLWHWPVFVFWGIYKVDPLTNLDRFGALFLTFGLASVTHHCVEVPARQQMHSWRASPVLAAGLATLIGLAVLAEALGSRRIVFDSYSSAEAQLVAALDYGGSPDWRAQSRLGTCYSADEEDAMACHGIDKIRPNVFLIGDSHAAMLAEALSTSARPARLVQITASGCGLPLIVEQDTIRCQAWHEKVKAALAKAKPTDQIVIAGRWAPAMLVPLEQALSGLPNQRQPIVIIGQFPSYPVELPRLLLKFGDRGAATRVDQRAFEMDDAVRRITERQRLQFVSPIDVFCPLRQCSVRLGGQTTAWDKGHLTRSAAAHFVAKSEIVATSGSAHNNRR